MTDLERFFRRLVGNLAGTDPARLHQPLPLDEVRHEIVPYRANRRALALDTSEDYEMVLLRLCSGEGGLVRTEPEEVRLRFVSELEAPNPDLGILQAFENVVLTLRSEPLARALDPELEPEASYAPPRTTGGEQPRDIPFLHPAELPEDTEDPVEHGSGGEAPAVRCIHCGGGLPAHRPVNFCPHCGGRQTVPTCPRCRGELEPGWKHCVNCGIAVGHG